MEEQFDLPNEFMDPILPCIKLLKNANVNLYSVKKSFLVKYFDLTLNLGSVVTYIISMTLYLLNVFKGNFKLDELAMVVSIYVVSSQAILKTLVVIFNKEEIRAIILRMGRTWRTEDLTEVQISKKNALLKRLKFCYAAIYWTNMIGSWQYILAPLLETVIRRFILHQECEMLLPFSCSFPFDPTGTWARYIGVYIFESYSMLRIIYIYLGSEFLMITLCSQLTTGFTLIQEDLLNLKPGDIATLRTIIENHQKLLCIAEQLDNVFSKVVFVNMSCTSITLCFFGLCIKVAHGVIDMANNFVAVLCLILPLFNLCFYGEQLSEASAGIADAMYNNLWYRGDMHHQKLLLFIMKRSQKPCCLTSMKYTPVTLNTFTAVLSTTWSYFSLASSVYDEES